MMRIFFFVAGHHRRYIDLDHVQQIIDLEYEEHPEEQKSDPDGIPYKKKAYGYATFKYQLAFQSLWQELTLEYQEERYEYEAIDDNIIRTNKVHAIEELRTFKSEYERFIAEWSHVKPEVT